MDDAAYLEAVREHPRATTQEVAELLGVSERAADHRLRKLFADVRIASKTIGNTLIWLPDSDSNGDVDSTSDEQARASSDE